MKKLSNNLKVTIWIYLGIFSSIILIFLWIFQVVSLNAYYEWSKKSELTQVITKIKHSYQESTYQDLFSEITQKYDICIELYKGSNNIYVSNYYNKTCTGDDKYSSNLTKKDFITSNESQKSYQINNVRVRRKSLMYGIRLENNTVIFVTSSLQPLTSTIDTLKSQFIIVTLLVMILSIIIGYYISKKLSKPIVTMNEKAQELAKGNYNIDFKPEESITEIDSLAETLNYATYQLSQTEGLRKELMANVSHDLKTPLTMIKAYAEMIRDLNYKDKKKTIDNLNVIINETDRLNILVNDMLELSIVEANNNLNIEEFDINELILEVLQTYEIYQTRDGYDIEYSSDLKPIVASDRKRISQVLHNIINNAINYTGNDKKVLINLIEKSSTVRIEITDTGKGISSKDLNYIWDKYYKADKTHSRVQVGSGIGLSIVKSILENHHVLYGVDSKKNHGTTFYFELNKEKKKTPTTQKLKLPNIIKNKKS